MLFAARLAAAGLVTVVWSAAELDAAVLAAAVRRDGVSALEQAAAAVEVPAGVHRVGGVVEEVAALARARRPQRARQR
jgi:hypothetical protein